MDVGKATRRRSRAWLAIPLGLVLSFVTAGSASAAVITVNDDTTGSGPAGANCGSPNFSTIQAALADVGTTAGSTVNVCAGTYSGAVTVNTADLTITGAGAGTNVQNVGSDVVTLGDGADGLTLQDLRISGSNRAMTTNSAVDDVTLRNLEMDGNALRGIEISNSAVIDDWMLDGVDIHDNTTGTGMRFRGDATDVTITDSHFDRNDFGMTSFTDTAPTSPGVLDDLQVSDTTFDGNSQKGMYFEQLSNSRFERILVRNSGVTSAFPAGIDVNVKYGDFANIQFVDSMISGSTGQGLAIKGRNDAPSYNADPASLRNVLLDSLTVTGNAKGIDVGYNVANATVQRSRIVGNTLWGLLSYVDTGVVDAGDNWWGCNAGPGGTGCDTTADNGTSSVDSNPRLVLGLSANPASVEAGGTSQVIADMTKNSAGQSVDATALNGRPVTFGTDFGSVSPGGGTLVNGQSSTTFTAGATPGTANVTATLDNQTSSAQVTVPEPPAGPPVGPPSDPGIGTDGDDLIDGTDGDDLLEGLGGDDELFGGLGDDEILGGDGDDDVNGGEGSDEVKGGSGDDDVSGGKGADDISGGDGDDDIKGGGGKDTIGGGSGGDTIDAHDGKEDTIRCGPDEDTLDADGKDEYGPNCENVS